MAKPEKAGTEEPLVVPFAAPTDRADGTTPAASTEELAGVEAARLCDDKYFGGAGLDSPAAKGLLGGKGAGLVTLARLGLPVPPGAVVTTAACEAYTAWRDARKGEPEAPPHDDIASPASAAVADGSNGGAAPELAGHCLPAEVWMEVLRGVRSIEWAHGRMLGSLEYPLLLSVRSGAAVSMPGMMDTVLNLGVCEANVGALGPAKFGWDCLRRFREMYGSVVLGVPRDAFERECDAAREAAGGVATDAELSADQMRELAARQAQVIKAHGCCIPDDVYEQLAQSVAAVFRSFQGSRARTYRRVHGLTGLRGTAVTIQAMVFGNRGGDSGAGVAFSRDPASGERGLYGEWAANAQGEDVVSGTRTPLALQDLRARLPRVYARLRECCDTLEAHYKDMQDTEFTFEEGTLFMLQTRAGKRTGRAAVRIAYSLVKEGIIDQTEALMRVEASHVEQVLMPSIPLATTQTQSYADAVIAKGLPAGPGAAVGKIVFSSAKAEELAAQGVPVLLVRTETSADDIAGMAAAAGVLTARGGVTSHAAVVARGWGKPCIVGAGEISIVPETEATDGPASSTPVAAAGAQGGIEIGTSTQTHAAAPAGLGSASAGAPGTSMVLRITAQKDKANRGAPLSTKTDAGSAGAAGGAEDASAMCDTLFLAEGTTLTINGTTGEVLLGGTHGVCAAHTTHELDTLLEWADATSSLRVLANADTPEDALAARAHGAVGIGLVRTEHMWFASPQRVAAIRRLILEGAFEGTDSHDVDAKVPKEGDQQQKGASAPPPSATPPAAVDVAAFQRSDFRAIFEAMSGLPVTIRLLDPPLHEFLPDVSALDDRGERGDTIRKQYMALARAMSLPYELVTQRARALAERNPMMGLRGCRLGIMRPELTAMQATAVIEAACDASEAGFTPMPKIMVPLVSCTEEYAHQAAVIEDACNAVLQRRGFLRATRSHSSAAGDGFVPAGATAEDDDELAAEARRELDEASEKPCLSYDVGVMIETPRAALIAAELAPRCAFFSFGSNDLTQLAYGFSRDDAQAGFLASYVEKRLLAHDPFVSIDKAGVGRLIWWAASAGRAANEHLHVSLCGEHAGDARSVAFLVREARLDSVSCSPARVPATRLAAAHAEILAARENGTTGPAAHSAVVGVGV
uniref:pyruvate, phosphate dikinase n=1 Tax=Prasinoderma coloniale TaxID=156133 RepID=A0A7R9TYC3_9VIRI